MIKRLLIIWLMMIPLWGLGQSKKANEYYNQGVNLFNTHRIEESVQVLKKSDALEKKELDETRPNRYRSERLIAMCWHQMATSAYTNGNYLEAVRIQERAVEVWERTNAPKNQNYIAMLNLLASCYYKIQNTNASINASLKSIEVIKSLSGEYNEEYTSALNSLAVLTCNAGRYNDAIKLGTQLVDITTKTIGERNALFAIYLSNLAGYYSLAGDMRQAFFYENRALAIRKEILGEDDPQYAASLNNLANYVVKLGNYGEAVRLESEVLKIRKAALGDRHPDYTFALFSLASYNLLARNYADAQKQFDECYNLLNSYVMLYFSSMTYQERRNFWSKYSTFFRERLVYAADLMDNPQQTILAYNGQLLSKGLILNAEVEIHKLIQQSGNAQLASSYKKLSANRALLDNLYQTPPKDRKMNADSLLSVIDNEELMLVQSLKPYGDYTRNLSIKWNDVQKNLNNNDIAVEFASYKDSLNRDVYVALVVAKEMKAPEIVRLFDQEELIAIKTADFYKTSKLYNLIWKPLTKYLNKANKVYFAPCGKLHTIGLEYMPDDNGNVLSEQYSAYRLSSTRELAITHNDNPNKKAATYGGIRYDASEETTLKRSGAAVYLAGTKVESEAVASLLSAVHYEVTALSDTAATEESLKNLSGTGLKILHIGTHGFYYNEDELSALGSSIFLDKNLTQEDRSLSGSGLLFAGANIILTADTRKAVTDGSDDGILTAKEISRLDFKGLDLVVLSACQSGLGEVTGEGVFGLQRGFKKAGAHTLVMSLWNVSDEATQLLMTEFFKNFTLGMTKRDAFVAAQKSVRKQFPHPGLWAAFVMVDGI